MTNIRNFFNVWPVKAKVIGVLTVLLVAICATTGDAADISAEYLFGRWVINEQNCSSADSEYIILRENRTFESTRAEKIETVGFWGLKDDVVELHMVASPASFADINGELVGYDGLYYYFQARVVVLNSQPNRFDAIGVLGDKIDRAYAVRCR